MKRKIVEVIKYILTFSIIMLISMLISYVIVKDIKFFIIPLVVITYYLYVVKWIEKKSLINKKVRVKLVIEERFKFFKVLKFDFENQEINKEIYNLNSYVFKIVFSMLILSYSSVLEILKKNAKISQSLYESLILLVIVSVLFSILLIIREIWITVKGIFKEKTALSIEIRNNKFKYISRNDYKYHHRDIVEYEEIYSKYSKKDLKREKIYLKAQYEKIKKKGFFDRYLMPILIVITGSLLGFVNSLFAIVLASDGGISNLDWVIKYYLLYVLMVSSPMLFIVWTVYFAKNNNPESIVRSLNVIEELLRQQN